MGDLHCCNSPLLRCYGNSYLCAVEEGEPQQLVQGGNSSRGHVHILCSSCRQYNAGKASLTEGMLRLQYLRAKAAVSEDPVMQDTVDPCCGPPSLIA